MQYEYVTKIIIMPHDSPYLTIMTILVFGVVMFVIIKKLMNNEKTEESE